MTQIPIKKYMTACENISLECLCHEISKRTNTDYGDPKSLAETQHSNIELNSDTSAQMSVFDLSQAPNRSVTSQIPPVWKKGITFPYQHL